jgi:hypothetical protein
MDSNHRCLDVGQESLPLDHGIKTVAEVGVEPTKSQALDLVALPVCVLGRQQSRVWESHTVCQEYEPRPDLVHPQKELQAPVSSRAHRPYESQSGTCQACKSVTKGRVALPRL